MKISIMGCGWLGFPLAQLLIAKGHQVKGSTTTASKVATLTAAGIEAYHLRIDGRKGMMDDFLKSELLIINIPPGRKKTEVESSYPMKINILTTRALEAGVSKIIFVSSTGVYGNENRVITERDKFRPIRASGRALVKVEWALKNLENIQLTIVRMAGLVGGTRKAGRFLAGKKDVPNPDAPVNLVHQEDCIHIIEQLIAQEKWGITLNICADEHPSRQAFYTLQARKEGLEVPTFLAATAPDFKIISNAKVKQVLDYTFRHPDPMLF